MKREETDWKNYDASIRRVEILEQRQYDEDSKAEKWLLTISSGSFGLSFTFIDQIVEIKYASNYEFLVTSWSCFTFIIILGIIGFIISSFSHSSLAKEENDNLALKYNGEETNYKKRSLYFSPNAILQYISILLLISGLAFLMLFIAINLIK